MKNGWGLRAPWRAPRRAPLSAGLIGALLLLMTLSGSALAESGEGSDLQERTSKLDIKRVYHMDSDGYVTFGLETYEGYDVGDDFYIAQWDFDFNNDGQAGDACVRVEQSTEETLRAVLYTDCGPESFGTAEVSKDGNTIEFRFPVSDLVDVGLVSGQAFGYRVTARDLENHEDVTPDGRTLVTQSGVELDEQQAEEIEERRQEEIVESQGGDEAAHAAAGSESAGGDGSDPSTSAGSDGPRPGVGSQPSSSGSDFPGGLLVALAVIAVAAVTASLAVERRRRMRIPAAEDPARVSERL